MRTHWTRRFLSSFGLAALAALTIAAGVGPAGAAGTFRVAVGVNLEPVLPKCTITLRMDDCGSFNNPALTSVNIKLARKFVVSGGHTLDFGFDVFNLFNVDTSTGITKTSVQRTASLPASSLPGWLSSGCDTASELKQTHQGRGGRSPSAFSFPGSEPRLGDCVRDDWTTEAKMESWAW